MPPLSSRSRWSGMKSMTGFAVNMSNSVELTSCVPMTSRANSMTAHCRPRHRPRYGRPGARAPSGRRGPCPRCRDGRSRPGRGRRPRPRAARSTLSAVSGLAVHPADLRVDAVRPRGVAQGLGDRQVGVGELDVLADERDLEGRLGRLDPLDERPPAVEVRLRLRVAQAELADEQPPEPERLELERDLVDRRGRGRRDDRVDVDVGEQGDLLADLVRHVAVRAQDDHVRLDADAAQLLHGVLGGLRLELARGRQGRQQRHVDVQDVVRAPRPCASGGWPRGTAGSRCRRPCRRPRR